jgi:hypothetical protein
MQWASKLPDAMDRLVAVFAAAPDLAGVTVRDGPSASQATMQEILSVGYTGSDDETDSETQTSAEGFNPARDREQFTIRCAAAVLQGAGGISAARKRAYEIVAAAGAALARDHTLGGTVLRAMIGSHSLSQDLTDRGVQVMVVFGVDCDAYSGI